MMGYVRERPFVHHAFWPSFRAAAAGHAWGGENLSPASKQGTTLPANATYTFSQIVARVTAAGTAPPGGDICSFTSNKDQASGGGIFLSQYDAGSTGWKRGTDNTVASSGAEDFDGEDYAGTPSELHGNLGVVGTSVSASASFTLHGRYTGQ